ncbi:MAG TPA: NAD(P)-dependent oxidoreductase [Vicinamibacterales bacterium]|nr:NAD(P)-dependent oxidoreductase [Vicinamibacterales bacterium]
MRLLVTGASGFVGRNLLLGTDSDWVVFAIYRRSTDFPAWVRANGLGHVVPIKCDLAIQEDVVALGRQLGGRTDVIVHLAANGDPAYSVRDPRGDLLDGPVSLVTLLTSVACDRLVYFSSGAVYDGLEGLVGPETPVEPTLPYAISKFACERYVQHFRSEGQISSYVIVRFFGAYGRYEPERKLFTRLVRWAGDASGSPFEVRGDGENLIDALHVDDLVRAVRLMMVAGVANHVVDLSSGAPLTINELVNRASLILGRPEGRIRHADTVPEYIRFSVSPDRMRRLYGFEPAIELEDGLLRLKAHLEPEETLP